MRRVLRSGLSKCCLRTAQNFATLAEMDHLDTRLQAELRNRRGDWRTIAARSGISYSWLSKFANGRIPNPGYASLLSLQEGLALPAPAAAAEHCGARDAA
jgi:transcriptional regulator with XRE-family HTH domain